VFCHHGVSIICEATEDGRTRYWLRKVTDALEGDVIAEDVAQGVRVGYIAAVVGRASIAGLWNVVMVARLSRGSLGAIVDHILPWLARANSLSREELSDQLARRSCPWGAYSTYASSHRAGLLVFQAIQESAFAQSTCCPCSVFRTCEECLLIGAEFSQFRCKYTMLTAGVRIGRELYAHGSRTHTWSERIASYCG
jgi:hypothetical protein